MSVKVTPVSMERPALTWWTGNLSTTINFLQIKGVINILKLMSNKKKEHCTCSIYIICVFPECNSTPFLGIYLSTITT